MSGMAAVYDLGEILAAGEAYVPLAAPTAPAAESAVLAPRENGALPEIRIADGSRSWREGVSAWLAAQKSEHTAAAYRNEAAKWHAWCVTAGVDPFAARRKHADVYARGPIRLDRLPGASSPPCPRSTHT